MWHIYVCIREEEGGAEGRDQWVEKYPKQRAGETKDSADQVRPCQSKSESDEEDLAKSKEKVESLEKVVVDLEKEGKNEYIQSTKYEEHIGQEIDAAVGDKIFTMFHKHPNFDYSYIGDAAMKLVSRYKQMVHKWKIELEASPLDDVPSTLLEVDVVTTANTVTNLLIDAINVNPPASKA